MTKEITKAYILQELQDKFKLRDLVPAKFTFEESVVPIYDIGNHIKYRTAQFHDEEITSIGSVVFFTVPDNEKWELERYDVVFHGVPSFTIAGVFIIRASQQGGNVSGSAYNYLDLEAAQNASYIRALPFPVDLAPGDTLSVNIDGFTSALHLRLYLDYVMEEIR